MKVKTFESICSLSQDALLEVMIKYLKSKYKDVRSTKDYVIAVGNIPIALVAHLDTVFRYTVKEIYYDKEKQVMWSPTGLGADDRAGIYGIIHLINLGYRPTIILLTDEEIGDLGALKLIKDYPKSPVELKYIIELDRRGAKDCVFYDCDNWNFIEYIESFGYSLNFGSFSDISVICPTWGIAGVNLSIGYYYEHTTSEILNIKQMLQSLERVEQMLRSAEAAPAFKYIHYKEVKKVARN